MGPISTGRLIGRLLILPGATGDPTRAGAVVHGCPSHYYWHHQFTVTNLACYNTSSNILKDPEQNLEQNYCDSDLQ